MMKLNICILSMFGYRRVKRNTAQLLSDTR